LTKAKFAFLTGEANESKTGVLYDLLPLMIRHSNPISSTIIIIKIDFDSYSIVD